MGKALMQSYFLFKCVEYISPNVEYKYRYGTIKHLVRKNLHTHPSTAKIMLQND